jgi:hypothetical protein
MVCWFKAVANIHKHNTKVESSVGPWQVQSLKSATIKSGMAWNVITMLVVLVVKTKKL